MRGVIRGIVRRGHSVDVVYGQGPEMSLAAADSLRVKLHRAKQQTSAFRWYVQGPGRSLYSRDYDSIVRELVPTADLVFETLHWSSHIMRHSGQVQRICSVHNLEDYELRFALPTSMQEFSTSCKSVIRSGHARRALRIAATPRVLGNHMVPIVSAISRQRPIVVPYCYDTAEDELTQLTIKSGRRNYGTIINANWGPSAEAGRKYLEGIRKRIRALDRSGHHFVAGWGSEMLADTDEDTTFLGGVTDLSEFFATIDVLVVAGHSGSGVRTKVLEALSRGVAIVGDISASNGLFSDINCGAIAPNGVSFHTSADELAHATVETANAARAGKIERSMLRRYVDAYHGPDTVAAQILSYASRTE